MLTALAISEIIGAHDYWRIAEIWQPLCAEMHNQGIDDPATMVAMAATVAVECSFKLEAENPSPDKFTGRGLIQLTGASNYAKYGIKLGLNLVENPKLAGQLNTSIRIAVSYFKDHGIPIWARRGHWWKVRRIVNGGDNGMDKFILYVSRMLDVAYVE